MGEALETESLKFARRVLIATLVVASVVLVALTVAGAWLVTWRIGAQLSELRQKLPVAVENVVRYVGQYEWARNAVDSLPNLNDWLAARSGTIVSGLTGLASTTLGTLASVIAAAVIGLLLASPLMAAMILVKMLYVEDLLGDRVTGGSGEACGGNRAGDERNV